MKAYWCYGKKDYVFNKDLVREPYTENFHVKIQQEKQGLARHQDLEVGKDTTYNAHEKGRFAT